MALDWSLLGQGPQFGNVLAAFQGGQQARKETDTKNALSRYSTDPEGAIAALNKVDPVMGMKLQADATARRRDAEQRAVFQETDPAKQDAMAAQSGDPDIQTKLLDLREKVVKLDGAKRDELHKTNEAVGSTLYGLAQIPAGPQRLAAYQQIKPAMDQLGATEFDPNDDNLLHVKINQAQSVDKIISQAQAAEKAKTDAADKAADNVRADATAAETARANHAREATAAFSAKDASARGWAGVQVDRQRLAQTGADAVSLSPDAIQQLAETVVAGGQLPALGMGKSATEARQAILNKVGEIRKAGGIDGYKAAETQAAYKADAASLKQVTQRKSTMKAFEGGALKNADLMLSLAPKGAGQTNIPVVNKWLQAGRKNIAGDPDVTAFDNAIGAFSEEYAKVMTGSLGNAAATDSARAAAHDRLGKFATQGQLKSGVNVMKQEMANQLSSLDDQEGSLRSRLSARPGSGGATPAKPSLASIFGK